MNMPITTRPNIFDSLGQSPGALAAYTRLMRLFLDAPELNDVERHVVWLTASVENECRYCVAAHTASGRAVGIDESTLDSLRAGQILSDPRLEALRLFTRDVVRHRGQVSEEARARLVEVGFAPTVIHAVLIGLAQKTISNYASHLLQPPLDERYVPFAWEPPR